MTTFTRVAAIVIWATGTALLLWVDWRVALGVFLFAWGDNFSKRGWR